MEVKNIDIKKINEKINKESAIIDLLSMELSKVIVGQKEMVDRLLVALLSDGHILLEGVPVLQKHLRLVHLQKLLMLTLVDYNLPQTFYQQIFLGLRFILPKKNLSL